MDKKTIRKGILETLKNLDKDYVLNAEKSIYEQLFKDENFINSKCVAITVPFGTEINTYPIIEKLLQDGKTVCSPICIKETRAMIFYKIESIESLVEGYYGIKTPPEIKENIVKKEDIELIIVPGVAFDDEKYRIGFGGGYYDRYLKNFKGHTIALALKEQIVKKVPTDEFDIAVQKVITN